MVPRKQRWTRRRFLTAGSLDSLAMGHSEVLRLRRLTAEAAQSDEPSGRGEQDTAVILVWLTGGLSHIDTYDLKPEAPREYRGEFNPISSTVRGVDVCEHLPMHAAIAEKFALIRSVTHGFAGHDGAHKRVLTGRVPKSPTGFVNDAPGVGSIVSRMRESRSRDSLVFTSGQRAGTNVDAYSQGSAYLGRSYAPFLVNGDPSKKDWSVPNLSVIPELDRRIDDRRKLLSGFDRFRSQIDQAGLLESSDRYRQKAFDLLTSDKARRAFDLSEEDPAVRKRYGMGPYGQQALVARRLVEAGTSFANVVMEHPGGPPPGNNVVYNWDCHAVNCHVFRDARWRLPHFDRAVSALIEDLYQRGLDRRVMLVVTGEFGHTPRINSQKGTASKVLQPGRDHWPGAMSMLVSGGGLEVGQVIGSTDAKAEHPRSRPLSPNDLWATVYRHLGIDTEHTFPDFTGRPMPILPDGAPIRELL